MKYYVIPNIIVKLAENYENIYVMKIYLGNMNWNINTKTLLAYLSELK